MCSRKSEKLPERVRWRQTERRSRLLSSWLLEIYCTYWYYFWYYRVVISVTWEVQLWSVSTAAWLWWLRWTRWTRWTRWLWRSVSLVSSYRTVRVRNNSYDDHQYKQLFYWQHSESVFGVVYSLMAGTRKGYPNYKLLQTVSVFNSCIFI
jgi:hypothetical protein